jgi:hypothetical protein
MAYRYNLGPDKELFLYPIGLTIIFSENFLCIPDTLNYEETEMAKKKAKAKKGGKKKARKAAKKAKPQAAPAAEAAGMGAA